MRPPATIQRVAVLGAGTMGSRIAAHLANAGLEVALLDRTKDLVHVAMQNLPTAKPPAFYDRSLANMIQIGGFDNDLSLLSDCDWIIEAVAEDLDIKQRLLWNVVPFVRESAIVSTNTSGLPVSKIAEALPDELRPQWLGTHFFNPPRYMRLVEIIPTRETNRAVADEIIQFIEQRLGKTVVLAKDTPNFIANRVGLFALLNAAKLMMDQDLSVEQVDAWTGSLIGWPSTATFRLMDLIGLDVLQSMFANAQSRIRDERSDVKFPLFMKNMLERNLLGQKTKSGFYRRSGDNFEVLNWQTLEYMPCTEIAVPEEWRLPALKQRLQIIEKESPFHQKFLPELWTYAQNRVGEIADTPEAIDIAMQAGFNWELGPFGMRGDQLHQARKGLSAFKQKPNAVSAHLGVSLVDLGNKVACIEFNTKMNAIDNHVCRFLTDTLTANQNELAAYVIYSDGPHFSAGANLQQILASIQEKDWSGLERFIQAFQKMTQSVKFCPVPVVATGFGLCLGGGAEVVMHAAAREVHAELTMGLVETGVGLIPGGGGCKEMAIRATDGLVSWQEAFGNIAQAKRSSSAPEAKQMGLLLQQDGISLNRDHLLEAAKTKALNLAAHYAPPVERRDIAPMPDFDIAAGPRSDYDRHIEEKLRYIFAKGGSEHDLLEREVEVFVSLCAEPKTAERIAYTLKTGKPLRN